MIWVIAFFIIILISSVLAYRSMRDYEEFPDTLSLTSLYYIGNPAGLNEETLKKLHDYFLKVNHFFSLEKLVKGREVARVLYGTRDLSGSFPELNLVEIEDYLSVDSFSLTLNNKTVSVDQSLSWLIDPKNNSKKPLHIEDQLRGLTAEENQKIFIQLVLMPFASPVAVAFQSTIRVMVADSDPIKRVELAKIVNQIFTSSTGLNKHEDAYAESKKFESFKQRSLVPKEVAEFPLTGEEVIAFVS